MTIQYKQGPEKAWWSLYFYGLKDINEPHVTKVFSFAVGSWEKFSTIEDCWILFRYFSGRDGVSSDVVTLFYEG